MNFPSVSLWLDGNCICIRMEPFFEVVDIKKKKVNGKPDYNEKNKNNWQIPSAFRGQLSGLFNSARLAGILDYDKKGNQFYLKKGPNFEKFKSGQLNPL